MLKPREPSVIRMAFFMCEMHKYEGAYLPYLTNFIKMHPVS